MLRWSTRTRAASPRPARITAATARLRIGICAELDFTGDPCVLLTAGLWRFAAWQASGADNSILSPSPSLPLVCIAKQRQFKVAAIHGINLWGTRRSGMRVSRFACLAGAWCLAVQGCGGTAFKLPPVSDREALLGGAGNRCRSASAAVSSAAMPITARRSARLARQLTERVASICARAATEECRFTFRYVDDDEVNAYVDEDSANLSSSRPAGLLRAGRRDRSRHGA